MFRNGFWIWRLLAGLILIGGLIFAGVLLFQAGHAQGYAQGVAVSGEEIQPAAPPASIFPGYYHRPHLFFFPFGGLFGMLLWGFLIFAFFGFLFRRRLWQHGGTNIHGYAPPWSKPQPAESGQEKESGPPPAPQA